MLRNSGFLKPNPYVEVLVDGKSVRKTETLKNTHHPRWDQELTVLVTPASALQFRLLDHSSFRKDTVLGEKTVFLTDLLRESRTDSYILYMNLNKPSNASMTAAGEVSPNGSARNSNSEMLVVIKGLVPMGAAQTNGGGGGGLAADGPTGVHNGDAVRRRSRPSGGGGGVTTEATAVMSAAATEEGGGGVADRQSAVSCWNDDDSQLLQRAMVVVSED